VTRFARLWSSGTPLTSRSAIEVACEAARHSTGHARPQAGRRRGPPFVLRVSVLRVSVLRVSVPPCHAVSSVSSVHSNLAVPSYLAHFPPCRKCRHFGRLV